VSIPALIAAPSAFLIFLVVKIGSKIVGVYPVTSATGAPNKEATYTTLLMSTGLTFGTISSLFGLSHGIIDRDQYSALVAAVIGSAVIPTMIANAFYLPHHLLPKAEPEKLTTEQGAPAFGRSSNRGHRHVQQDLARKRRLRGRVPRAFAGARHRQQNNADLHMVSVEEIPYLPNSSKRFGRGDRNSCSSLSRGF